jgi:hypothetical protein
VLLTAEELHFLAASLELAYVPGLGALPLDPGDPPSERFMLGTAERSLSARADVADAVREVLAPLSDPEWAASAEVTGPSLVGARGWWPVADGCAELTQISPTDYELVVIDDFAESFAAFLLLDDGDASVGTAEAADDARLEALAAEAVIVAQASRVARAGEGEAAVGVELEWIDPGEGPLWVIADKTVTRTGRAAVLYELLGGDLD